MEEERFIWFAKEKACIEAVEEKPKVYNPAITSLSKALSQVSWEITPYQELLSMICLWTRKHSSVAPCLSSEFSRNDLKSFSSYWEQKFKLTNSMENFSRVEAKMQEHRALHFAKNSKTANGKKRRIPITNPRRYTSQCNERVSVTPPFSWDNFQ